MEKHKILNLAGKFYSITIKLLHTICFKTCKSATLTSISFARKNLNWRLNWRQTRKVQINASGYKMLYQDEIQPHILQLNIFPVIRPSIGRTSIYVYIYMWITLVKVEMNRRQSVCFMADGMNMERLTEWERQARWRDMVWWVVSA